MATPRRYQTLPCYQPPAAKSGHDPALLHQVNTDAAGTWQLGYAPAGRRTLVGHLRGLGYGDRDIHIAGLARHNRRGLLVDRFRDRLVFPVHDNHATVVGWLAGPAWLIIHRSHRTLSGQVRVQRLCAAVGRRTCHVCRPGGSFVRR